MPNPTPIKTDITGVGWRPTTLTTKPENLALWRAKVYNELTRNYGIGIMKGWPQ